MALIKSMAHGLSAFSEPCYHQRMATRCRPLLLGIIVTMGLGCGSKSASGSTATPPGGHLTIIPATLEASGEQITIHASGEVAVAGQRVGTLHPDGRFTGTEGTVIAVLEPSGRIRAGERVLDDTRITDDGALVLRGRTLAIDPRGRLEGVDGLSIQVGPRGRRAALFVLLLAALSGPATSG